MKQLPIEKVWTGDGFGGNNPVILSQIKRTDKVALYSRRRQSSPTIEGFEVFLVKMRHKGDPLPGGSVELEDREVYPSSGMFGKIAFALGPNLEKAEKRFDDLVNQSVGEQHPVQVNHGDSEDLQPFPPVEGTFTIQEFADSKGLTYAKAFTFFRELVESGKVISAGKRPSNGSRGKSPGLYRYV